MTNARKRYSKIGIMAWCIALCICSAAAGAVADGVMPTMPKPPTSPVYWQLVRISQEPEITPTSGYVINYETRGLTFDLVDGLMAESLLEVDASFQPEASLSVSKDGPLIEHTYAWTPLPIYLEKDAVYPITVKGMANLTHTRINSRLSPYVQDNSLGRISASAYNDYADNLSFTISTADGLYKDGRFVVSFLIRDVHDMFRLRIDYTYAMQEGVKPSPTPVPGFSARELPVGAAPAYYDAVPGVPGLWHVTTAPEEFRTYGSMNGGEPRFFPADSSGYVVMNATPADLTKDFMSFVQGFVSTEPTTLPAHYRVLSPGVYGFTSRDGMQITRAHGRVDGAADAFYPYVGDPAVVSTIEGPIDPDDDFITYIAGFGASEPAEPFPYYQKNGNVYAITGRDGVTRYRVYGRLDGAEPAYYEATMDGTIIEGLQQVIPAEDFASFIEGFDALTPSVIPTYYKVVSEGLYMLTDNDAKPLYRVYGILDGDQPAYYPADSSGNRLDGQQAISPEDDFTQYIAGFTTMQPQEVPYFYEETETAGVWAFKDVHGEMHYRTYGELNRGTSAFYPSDENGNVDVTALPVKPASDLAMVPPPPVFNTAQPTEVPSFYIPVPDHQGLFTFTDKDGQAVYRVFGGYDDAKPAFYPASANGVNEENAQPVDAEADTAIAATPVSTPRISVVVTPTPTNAPAESVVRTVSAMPSPTSYAYAITPQAQKQTSAPVIVREIAEMLPMPTPYAYSIMPTKVAAVQANAPITRTITAPEPTPYAYTVAETQTPDVQSSAPVISRTTTPPPQATTYAYTVAPIQAPTDQVTPASQIRTITEAPSPTAYVKDVQTAAEPTATATAVQRITTATPAATAYVKEVQTAAEPTATATAIQRITTATPTATAAPTVPPATQPPEATNTTAIPVNASVKVDGTVTSAPATNVPTPSATVTIETLTSAPTQVATKQPTVTATAAEATATAAPVQTEAAPQTDAPVQTATPVPTEVPTVTPADKETGNTIMLVIGIALSVILIGGGAAMLLRRKK